MLADPLRPVWEHCRKLAALISGIDRVDIRADFDPDAWPFQPS